MEIPQICPLFLENQLIQCWDYIAENRPTFETLQKSIQILHNEYKDYTSSSIENLCRISNIGNEIIVLESRPTSSIYVESDNTFDSNNQSDYLRMN